MQLVLKYTLDCEFGTWITEVWDICMRERWQERWGNAGRKGPRAKSWNNKTKEKKGETESFQGAFTYIISFFHHHQSLVVHCILIKFSTEKIEAFARWSKTLNVTQQISSRERITTQAISRPVDNNVSFASRVPSVQQDGKWNFILQNKWSEIKDFKGKNKGCNWLEKYNSIFFTVCPLKWLFQGPCRSLLHLCLYLFKEEIRS